MSLQVHRGAGSPLEGGNAEENRKNVLRIQNWELKALRSICLHLGDENCSSDLAEDYVNQHSKIIMLIDAVRDAARSILQQLSSPSENRSSVMKNLLFYVNLCVKLITVIYRWRKYHYFPNPCINATSGNLSERVVIYSLIAGLNAEIYLLFMREMGHEIKSSMTYHFILSMFECCMSVPTTSTSPNMNLFVNRNIQQSTQALDPRLAPVVKAFRDLLLLDATLERVYTRLGDQYSTNNSNHHNENYGAHQYSQDPFRYFPVFKFAYCGMRSPANSIPMLK